MYRLPRALIQRSHPPVRSLIPPRRIHPSRIHSRQQSEYFHGATDEPVQYQAVRFKKPSFFSLRRLATFGLYSFIIYNCFTLLLQRLPVDIEFIDEEDMPDEAEEGEEDEDAEGEEEGPPFYADEDSTFIPLTWSKKLPRTFYRGSDPEWQEFIRIARDKGRHKKIQDELVQLVFTGSTQHPPIARLLGKDSKVGKYWLDISFPDGPPPEFERSGIEIGDGFVAWSQQKISPEKQWRLMRALWPEAAALSSWATVKVLAGIQYRRAKQALGWEGVDPMAPEERFKTAMEMLDKQENNKNARERKEEVTSGQTDPAGTLTTTASPADEKKTPWYLPPLPLPSPENPTATTDIPIAMHVFQSTLSKSWNPKRMEPPRGAFVVQGLVEVRGQKGKILLDVQSCYDPKAAKFVQVNAGVRGFKRWSQAPRGGP